jgi:fatty acid desaturase
VPVGLTEPFWHYREDHLRHHECDDLTDPVGDPESQYVTGSAWHRLGPLARLARVVNTTLAGRMIVGPWLTASSVARDLAQRWRRGERRWSIVRFVIADFAVIATVSALGFPVWQYLVGVVYVGTSLTLVRSYAEHRAVPSGSPTAVVRGHGFWALLFLNNNLHVTHHRRPGLAWYELPAAHAASDADAVAANGAGLYRGYAEIFRRFLVRPVGPPVDPLDRSRTVA